jgi:hypothetical protein
MKTTLLFGAFLLSATCFAQNPSSISGKGTVDATYAIAMMDQKFVESLLGPELKITPVAPGVHPVVFMFGHQIGVDFFNADPFPFHGPKDYLEFIMTVPYVSFKSDTL